VSLARASDGFVSFQFSFSSCTHTRVLMMRITVMVVDTLRHSNVHARPKDAHQRMDWLAAATVWLVGCYAAATSSLDIFSSSRIKSLKTFSSQTALRHDLTT